MVVRCVSVDTTILHTFLSEPACTACTNMVYSKELERDVTTTAMAQALLRLKTWHHSFIERDVTTTAKDLLRVKTLA